MRSLNGISKNARAASKVQRWVVVCGAGDAWRGEALVTAVVIDEGAWFRCDCAQ
jgi:hypothetical protein